MKNVIYFPLSLLCKWDASYHAVRLNLGGGGVRINTSRSRNCACLVPSPLAESDIVYWLSFLLYLSILSELRLWIFNKLHKAWRCQFIVVLNELNYFMMPIMNTLHSQAEIQCSEWEKYTSSYVCKTWLHRLIYNIDTRACIPSMHNLM